jgi:hypothetical protein
MTKQELKGYTQQKLSRTLDQAADSVAEAAAALAQSTPALLELVAVKRNGNGSKAMPTAG